MKRIKWILFSILIGLCIMECYAAIRHSTIFSTNYHDTTRALVAIEIHEINNHDYIIVSGSGVAITHDLNCRYCKNKSDL